MGKRGPKKGQGGRPPSGKYSEETRRFWREKKEYYRNLKEIYSSLTSSEISELLTNRRVQTTIAKEYVKSLVCTYDLEIGK